MCCLGTTVHSNKSQPSHQSALLAPASEVQLLLWPHGVSRVSEETNQICHSLTVQATEPLWVFGEEYERAESDLFLQYVSLQYIKYIYVYIYIYIYVKSFLGQE